MINKQAIMDAGILNLFFALGLLVVITSAFILFYSLLPLLDTPEKKAKKRILLIVFFTGIFIGLIFWRNNFDLVQMETYFFVVFLEYPWVFALMILLLAGLHHLFWNVVYPRYLGPCEFDSEIWKKAGSFDRNRMVADLLEKKLLDLLSEQEVINLLGEPERKIDELWEYRLSDNSFINIFFDQTKKVRKGAITP